MADRAANGQLQPGHSGLPGSGPKRDSPLATFRRALRKKPLPGELDRMIVAFEIPEDVAAELRLCENGMEAMVMLAMHRAHTGSWDAWREIMDRVAPKPRAVELSGPGGGHIQTAAAVSVQVTDGDAARQYQDLIQAAIVVDAEFEAEDDDEPEAVDPLLL